MNLSRKQIAALLVLALLLVPQSVSVASVSVEVTMSTRQSVRAYTAENITDQELLQVLHEAYGYWGNHRSTPQIGSDRALVTFATNATGTYQYIPENNVLVVYDLSVNKETIRPYDQSYPSDSSVVLIPVWNKTRMNNVFFAFAEAGCFAQNANLAAVSLGLATICVGGISESGMGYALKLPNSMVPILAMPLGYPTFSYPSAAPDFSRMNGNLPPVQYSNRTIEDALNSMIFARTWSPEHISSQELSQLLWAAYGYSNTTHRTTPSAYNIYSLKVLVSNATGTYQFIPETHSVTKLVDSDKRADIANACGGQTWAANAPTLFTVVFDSTLGGEGDTTSNHKYIEIDAGCVIQQLLLEGSAWNLGGNLVSNGLEDWNGTGAAALQQIMSLPTSQIPVYVVPVGHVNTSPTPENIQAWHWTNNTTITSTATGDVDNDGLQEIVTGGYYNDDTRNIAQLVEWSGSKLSVERLTGWFWTNNTVINSVAIGDVDNDGQAEVVTGGYFNDGTRNVAQLIEWNGATLAVERLTAWYWTGNTVINSVALGDVDGDGQAEIVTGGYFNDGSREVAQLIEWNGGDLTVDRLTAWYWTSNTVINSVALGDVDSDGQSEVVTGGYFNDGSRNIAQLVEWNGVSLVVDRLTGWYWTDNTVINSVAIGDADGDRQTEVVTAGYYYDGQRNNAQLIEWVSSSLAVDRLTGWYWNDNTVINSVAIGDADNDGKIEIVTGGYFNGGARNIAQLIEWNGATIVVDKLTSWYWTSDTAINAISLSDVDNDTQIEVVTGGYYNDSLRLNSQLIVWSIP